MLIYIGVNIYAQGDETLDLREKLFQIEDNTASLGENISDYIFNHPELGDAEFESSKYLVEVLREQGFEVEYPYMGLATAFRAEYGDAEGPKVCFMAEYDALLGYGENHDEMAHACGHNWIAASSVMAAVALKGVKEHFKGKIVVIGTPAEENFGRKVDMAAAGVFDEFDACFEMHLDTHNCIDTKALAMTDFVFEFDGKAAHAAGHPADGINALDGCNLTIAGINALRQHLEPDVRIHYVYMDGGKSPNVVPEHASLAVYVRAGQKDYLEEVIEKVLNCGRGAELMTGAKFSYTRAQNTFYDIKHDKQLDELMESHLRDLGITEFLAGDIYHSGSTDVGNVTYHCPVCYVHLGLGAVTSAGCHEEAILPHVNSAESNRLLHIAAKAMAATALDVISKGGK